jgi:ATP synthase F1 gamma subunit
MIPLIKLRENLRFARELQDMIEVMKGATASQFRSLQAKRKGFEDYKTKMEEFLTALDVGSIPHPFLRERADLPKAIVMITSDEGFVGALNAQVVTAGLEQASGLDELVVIGERGARYLAENQGATFTVFPGIGDDITYARAVAVRDLLIEKFLARKIGSVLIAYPRFLSLTAQRVDVARVLPCGNIFGPKADVRHKPVKAKEILIEPSPDKVVNYMVRAWMMQRIYDMFWESKLSECAARIIHLEGSHEEILSENKKLMHEYFKHLHARSDKNIREIFASRLKWRSEVSGVAPVRPEEVVV